MRITRISIVALASILVLAVCILGFATRSIANPAAQDEPIIVRGGSLEIQCPGNEDCLNAPSNGKYIHRKATGKIERIVIRGTGGGVLFDSSEAGVPQLGGRPEIEIHYR